MIVMLQISNNNFSLFLLLKDDGIADSTKTMSLSHDDNNQHIKTVDRDIKVHVGDVDDAIINNIAFKSFLNGWYYIGEKGIFAGFYSSLVIQNVF